MGIPRKRAGSDWCQLLCGCFSDPLGKSEQDEEGYGGKAIVGDTASIRVEGCYTPYSWPQALRVVSLLPSHPVSHLTPHCSLLSLLRSFWESSLESIQHRAFTCPRRPVCPSSTNCRVFPPPVWVLGMRRCRLGRYVLAHTHQTDRVLGQRELCTHVCLRHR